MGQQPTSITVITITITTTTTITVTTTTTTTTTTTKIYRDSPFTASGIQTGGLVESRECLERERRQGIYRTTTNRGTSSERIRGASAEGNKNMSIQMVVSIQRWPKCTR
jgi:hypothetical protein